MAITTRRTVLLRFVAALTAVWAALRAWAPGQRHDWQRLGVEAAQAGWFADATTHVWLIRDADGRLAVLDRLCPHQGCIVRERADDLWCPCHGSTFSRDGALRGGPAPHGLRWYPLRRRGHSIWIDVAQPQARAQWL